MELFFSRLFIYLPEASFCPDCVYVHKLASIDQGIIDSAFILMFVALHRMTGILRSKSITQPVELRFTENRGRAIFIMEKAIIVLFILWNCGVAAFAQTERKPINKNLVLAGVKLRNNSANSLFRTPQDATQIALDPTFLHPEKQQSSTLQDIGLFELDISEWQKGNLPQNYAPVSGRSHLLQKWLFVLSLVVIALLILDDSRLQVKSADTGNLKIGHFVA